MIRLPLLAAFVLLHLTSSGRAVPFDEGERFVCLGDSITHGGLYPYDLQLFQLLRSPGSTELNGDTYAKQNSAGLNE